MLWRCMLWRRCCTKGPLHALRLHALVAVLPHRGRACFGGSVIALLPFACKPWPVADCCRAASFCTQDLDCHRSRSCNHARVPVGTPRIFVHACKVRAANSPTVWCTFHSPARARCHLLCSLLMRTYPAVQVCVALYHLSNTQGRHDVSIKYIRRCATVLKLSSR